MSVSYAEQDQLVLSGEAEVHDQLELHLYPDRDPGWCLTHKIPVRDAQKNIIGLSGISRDLAMPDQRHPAYPLWNGRMPRPHMRRGESFFILLEQG